MDAVQTLVLAVGLQACDIITCPRPTGLCSTLFALIFKDPSTSESYNLNLDMTDKDNDPNQTASSVYTEESQPQATESNGTDTVQDRQTRFKALQARAKRSAQHNLKEAAAESQRLATDPNALSTISRQHATASHNLLKADTAAAGEDFERKRAWDWTIEESEKWDKRMEKKAKNQDNVAFQDYRQDSRKVYKRQMRDLKPDLEKYEKDKTEALAKAAANGSLEIVEGDNGELIVVDNNSTFYSTVDSTDFASHKPDKAAVDRLVKDLEKAEAVRMEKRRKRRGGEDDSDVTYINDKNKQFNQKLARFYNRVGFIVIKMDIVLIVY